MSFQRIDTSKLNDLLERAMPIVIDIRDAASYSAAHIPSAIAAHQLDLDAFLASTPKGQAIVVYCYHGLSSQDAAHYFAAKGFENVYSLDGGFEEWRSWTSNNDSSSPD